MGFLKSFLGGARDGFVAETTGKKVPSQRLKRSSGPREAHGQLVPITIVGEQAYQPLIKQIAKQAKGREFKIVLEPQPNNPHDRNAVAVLVDGHTVGYLPRELAPEWQPTLLAAQAEGFVVTGQAAIFGGTKDKPSVGVFGSATWPHGATPPKATPWQRKDRR